MLVHLIELFRGFDPICWRGFLIAFDFVRFVRWIFLGVVRSSS